MPPRSSPSSIQESSKLLWAISREELLESDLPDDIVAEVHYLHRLLIGLMIRLAVNLWDRKDARAVHTITTCIVDLPTAIMLRRDRLANPTARNAPAGVGACGPRRRTTAPQERKEIVGLSLSYEDKIAVLDLGDDENRFSPEFLDAVDAHLDKLVDSGAQGLVTTGGAKFYTNGLDLDWLAGQRRTGASGMSDECRACWPASSPCPSRPRPHWSATPSVLGQCWPWLTTFG